MSWLFNRNLAVWKGEAQDIQNDERKKNLKPRILYPERLSFRFEGEIKSVTDKQKLSVQHHQPGFKELLKGLL